jgi:hypothetical protein
MFRMVAEAAERKANADAAIDEVRMQGERDGVYVWAQAVEQIHVDHCVKVLASRKGDLGNPEKFFAAKGACVLL